MSMNWFLRTQGTKSGGSNFNEEEIQEVWEKGIAVLGYDKDVYRLDSCNALIKRSEYGRIHGSNGWEIDHIKPVAKGGGDEISNLQPLYWENNRHKSDNYPVWECRCSKT